MGWMMSPNGWRRPQRGSDSMPFALDNGLFHQFGEPQKGMKALPPFYAMMRKCLALGTVPLFVVAPDVPYDGAASLPLSQKHAGHIAAEFPEFPIALAVQDGMAFDALDDERFDAVFVAGSTGWKWATAQRWVGEAHARGMWAHVARVNTKRRVRQCIDFGADSCDGSGIFRGDKIQLGGVLEAITEQHLFLNRRP